MAAREHDPRANTIAACRGVIWGCIGIALIAAIVGAQHRVDRALDLWYCHAAVGYGHRAELDTCLGGER